MGEEYNNLGTNIERKKISKNIVNIAREDKMPISESSNNFMIVLEDPDQNFFLPEMYAQIKRLINTYLTG